MIAARLALVAALAADWFVQRLVGAGQVTKICNQLIVAANSLLIAETVALAEHAGVDAGLLTQIIINGSCVVFTVIAIATVDRWGNNSDIQVPLWPCCLNWKGEPWRAVSVPMKGVAGSASSTGFWLRITRSLSGELPAVLSTAKKSFVL